MRRAVIFDLDGTLVDSVHDLQQAANELVGEDGLPPIDLPSVIRFIGNGLSKFVERCYTHRGTIPADLATKVARFAEIYDRQGYPDTVLFPGVTTALLALRDRNYRLAICTNKDSAPTRRILAKLNLTALFDAVVCGDSLPVKKPDPAILLATARFCDVPLEGAVFVGDSEVDAEVCQRAATPFLLFTRGYRKTPAEKMPAAAIFSHYADLPSLVEALHEKRA